VPQDILEKVTADVLKLKEFDEAIFRAKVDHIDVFNDSRLIYHFKSGETIEQSWSYPSRKESWSKEMKELARKRTNEMNERRKLCQESQ
jgi:hypothetical protein